MSEVSKCVTVETDRGIFPIELCHWLKTVTADKSNAGVIAKEVWRDIGKKLKHTHTMVGTNQPPYEESPLLFRYCPFCGVCIQKYNEPTQQEPK